MGILDYLRYMFSYRRKVYTLRRRYDRAREKADKQKNTQKRLAALRALDQVEPTLVMLEEQNISRFDRGRLALYVIQGIENSRRMLKEEEYIKTGRMQKSR